MAKVETNSFKGRTEGRPTVSKGEKKFENKSFKGRPTVLKGEQQFQRENNGFKWRTTVSKGEQKFENKSLAKGETNSGKKWD